VSPCPGGVLAEAPSFLLSRVARLLPADRQDWGRAMQAELAGIGPASERWRFTLGCTRAVLSRPAVIAKVGWCASLAGLLAAAAALAVEIPFDSIRREAIAMVAFLAGLFWLTRRPQLFGPVASNRTAQLVLAAGLAAGAAKVLIFLNDLRRMPDGPDFATSTTLVVVWTLTLTVYLLALVRATSRRAAIPTRSLATGAGVGAGATALWLLAIVLWPSLPSSSAPEVFAMTVAAEVALALELRSGRIGLASSLVTGVLAAATTALLIGVLLDGPLPALTRWVPNSAPPVWPPDAPHRLVDSIGVWLLGLLLAAVLSLAIRSNQPNPHQPNPSNPSPFSQPSGA
jgi:hypothetical protein